MFMRTAAFTLLTILAGCGTGEPVPAGYFEACYGGNFSTHLAGRSAFLSADVDISESDWPKLAALLESAAAKRGVKFFNDTRHNEGLSMIMVSLCSPDGLFLTADKRVWKQSGSATFPDAPVLVTAFSYKDEPAWRPFANDLLETLRQEWPDRVSIPSKRTSQSKNSIL
jgi:hypothetical protein